MQRLNMEDDQRAMNRCAHDDERIKIDLEKIFKNHGMFDRDLDNHGDTSSAFPAARRFRSSSKYVATSAAERSLAIR